MNKIMEDLEARVAASKQRLDEATKTFQTAQQAYQVAQQDHNVWSLALQAEVRDEQRRDAAATEKQSELPLSTAKPSPPSSIVAPIEQSVDSPESLNKTDAVRNLLRQHSTGMSAVDIWKEVGAQFKHRPYLYSVLKRLRDRDEVIMRRNKYFLKFIPKTEEAKEQPVVH
ncbi:MAG: hypothetical protein ABSD64_12770 [Terriglobales bacterium]|jgi:type II secretory pathway pseudopilin PulG